MTPEFADAVKGLLGLDLAQATSKDVGTRAAMELGRLTTHVARLLGEMGISTVVLRSVRIASSTFPFLADVTVSNEMDGQYSMLARALESESVETARAGFTHVLFTLVQLLERLIGKGLVSQLLSEVWPTVFPPAVKES